MAGGLRAVACWNISYPWRYRWAIAGLAVMLGFCAYATSLCSYATEPTQNAPAEDQAQVALARERAKVMHQVYAATLEVMHERYFHDERAIVPARALEDVFSEIRRQTQAEARWISVNLKAMSVNHEPKSDFEKKAAKEIAQGESEIETVEEGYYRRAGAIPLGDGCISCHTGFFKEPSKTPKFAALIISVPVNGNSKGNSKDSSATTK